MKKLLLFCLVVLAILAYYFFHKRSSQDFVVHENRKSEIQLNPSQLAEMPKAAVNDFVSVQRYQDGNGVWQLTIGEAPAGAQNVQSMGQLHKTPLPGEVEVPLYLCYFKSKNGESANLDTSAKCSGQGRTGDHLVLAGYVSKLIRTGYFFAVNCRTDNNGIYLSLNAHCESGKDHFYSIIGAIKAGAIQGQ